MFKELIVPGSRSSAFSLRIAFIVALLSMVAPFSIDTYLPSFPDIAQELAASPLQMQQTLSFYLLGFAVTMLFYGPLSDAVGRRHVAIAALTLYTISSALSALSNDIHMLIATRIGQGMSASAGVVVGRAMIRDVFAGHHAQRVMARVMMIFAIAPAIAPMIGGWLHELFGWRSVFWFLTLLGVALIVMLAMATPETLPREGRHSFHPRHVLRVYLQALRHRRFVGLTAVFASMFGGFFLYVASSPAIIYEHLHLGPDDFWVMFVPMVAGIMGGSILTSRLAGKVTPVRTVNLGFMVMGGAALLNVLQSYALTASPVSVIGPLVMYALGSSLAMPGLSLMAMDCFPHNRGMAAAVQGFTQMSFNAVVAGAVVPIVSHAVHTLALAMLGMSLVAFAIWWLVEHFTADPAAAHTP
ncbi:MAG TPA: multidrug effflux MFS transporter [Gammaproteobacteria bacterium]